MTRSTSGVLRWTLLVLSLVLVCLPRFNRNDHLIARPPADDVQYQLYVQLFRGEDVGGQLRAASTWRPLTPFLASLLPFAPMTALNVVNLLGLLAALVFLYKLLRRLRLGEAPVWVGLLLFVFSFPTFYYGTIGYVDPLLLAFLCLGTYLIFTERWLLLGLAVAVGTLAKEGIVILIPVAFAFLFVHRRPRRLYLLPLAYLVLHVALSLFIRAVAPGSTHMPFWEPSPDQFLVNAVRPRAWLSALLTFGLPGLLALPLLFRISTLPEPRRREARTLAVGFLAALATWASAMVAAYADGRTMWTIYPFAIPLAMMWLEARLQLRPSPAAGLSESVSSP